MEIEKISNHKNNDKLSVYYLGPQGFDIKREKKIWEKNPHNAWSYEEYAFQNYIASVDGEILAIGPHATDQLFQKTNLGAIGIPDGLIFHHEYNSWVLSELLEFKSGIEYDSEEKLIKFHSLIKSLRNQTPLFITERVNMMIKKIQSEEELLYTKNQLLHIPDPHTILVPDQRHIEVKFFNPYINKSIAPTLHKRTNFHVSHVHLPWNK